MSALTGPFSIAGRSAPSRVLFGPHETNLARGRALADRHVAYYAARAAGGAGVLVTETASVHESDWPYERAPLAALCGSGWKSIVDACRGSLVLAGLGHSGSQGSSAYGQQALWAPSRVPDVASRELPMEMEQPELAALVAGFRDAAALAVESGVDGVELDAGQYSLLRQFLSPLTNQRDDAYGIDKSALLSEVLGAVREAIGDRILGLRLSCDERAPWAGLTPEQAAKIAADLAPSVDYLVPVRGSAMSASATRPDLHVEPGFNFELCRRVTEAVGGRTRTVLQGGVVDPGQAQRALDAGVADLVEMTRAQIAEPELVGKIRAGRLPRPCVLSNQKCRVRDPRNPIVSCIGEPRSGHETEDPAPVGADSPREVLVVGGGPAGLEAARVLAFRGHTVELRERGDHLGGMLRVAAKVAGRARLGKLADWLEDEVHRLGVRVVTGAEVTGAPADAIVATGSVAGPRNYAIHGGTIVDVVDLLNGAALPDGPVLVHDPIGDPVGVGIAELLAAQGKPTLIQSQDQVVGAQLALTGDLADANARLRRAGVALVTRSKLREVRAGHVVVEDVFTAERRELECTSVVHCGHRLPDGLAGHLRAGDCVAPRTVHEAVLEGRRAALILGAGVPA